MDSFYAYLNLSFEEFTLLGGWAKLAVRHEVANKSCGALK